MTNQVREAVKRFCRTEQATDNLVKLIEALLREARVDELERLYLVYGSKDNPASLDNLFSLGKKGEVVATPIKKRLAELQKSDNV